MSKKPTKRKRVPRKGKKKSRGGNSDRSLGRGILKAASLLALLVILSTAFVIGYRALISSPYLKLENIRITGVDRETQRELIRISELNTGMSLVPLDLREIKRRMESHEWIRSVKLERRFPHTLLVHAEPQEPMALVRLNKLYFMNTAGELFKELDNQDNPDFPIVTGLSEEDPEAADKLRAAARVLNTLKKEQPPWSLENLSELNVKDYGRVSIYFRHLALEIRATVDDLEQRMDGFREVAAHLEKEGRLHRVATINLNQRGDAVISFKKS